ncbi:MAG TPA: DUF4230 domain-containing protein, partial [Sediminispirochaeta sp.]|nr:DUF4230 domain-containing protein [Sediminispirochaeta sp.]
SLPFIDRQEFAGSSAILRDLRPLFELNTVEYSYKSVFPYDFIPEATDISRAYAKFVRREELTRQEQEAAELYRLCAEAGIRIWSGDYPFVVITSRVKGGYQLAGSRWSSLDGGASPIKVNPSLNTIEIELPPATITSFVIRDETSDEYPYPDLRVDAESWKKITGYVEEKIRQKVIEDGILRKTEELNREALRRILKEAGWKNIVFTGSGNELRESSSQPAPQNGDTQPAAH